MSRAAAVDQEIVDSSPQYAEDANDSTPDSTASPGDLVITNVDVKEQVRNVDEATANNATANQVIVQVSEKDDVQTIKINNSNTNPNPTYIFVFLSKSSAQKVDIQKN
ncbi:hypothetical protein AWZ03_013755 [Drosophila navojoa]|uniref:Uncharacterized protein n=1 Tax=Drosophila navojoa TaxID=7232 RepID=A0A484AW79_DRONA|nr:hypothetical protein AWZ03_013755 [Drosophila navojoa]